MLAGVLAFLVPGARLHEGSMPGLDWLMGFATCSVMFSVVAVAGAANTM